jgi:carboxyl-terminal processing protease
MSFRNKFILVIISATLSLYAMVGGLMSSRAQQQQQNDPGTQLRIFQSVLQHIQNEYVDEPDLNKVRAGALRGLAYGLDPYSSYLTAEQVAQYRANRNTNTQVGIGAELSQYASYLYVIAPVKGGPADTAGIRAGDIIEYIGDRATRDISLYDARQLLNGAAGSEVRLRIIRAGAGRLPITVRRGAVRTPVVETRMEADRIGIVRVNSLDEGEAADVRTRVQELQRQGAQKIVLDLRSVAGGSLQEAVRVANLFIREGALAQTIGRGGRVLQTFNADANQAIFDGPTVALIDRSTAGAAEVIASAFRERSRGEVVGEKSFGAGSEQELFTLRGGDGMLLTTVKWASGNGRPFLGNGVEPSVEVRRPELAEAINPENLTGNETDEITRPNQNPAQPQTAPETAPQQRPQTEDVQLQRALEILRRPQAQQRAA